MEKRGLKSSRLAKIPQDTRLGGPKSLQSRFASSETPELVQVACIGGGDAKINRAAKPLSNSAGPSDLANAPGWIIPVTVTKALGMKMVGGLLVFRSIFADPAS